MPITLRILAILFRLPLPVLSAPSRKRHACLPAVPYDESGGKRESDVIDYFTFFAIRHRLLDDAPPTKTTLRSIRG
jgi:hypothetical protein